MPAPSYAANHPQKPCAVASRSSHWVRKPSRGSLLLRFRLFFKRFGKCFFALCRTFDGTPSSGPLFLFVDLITFTRLIFVALVVVAASSFEWQETHRPDFALRSLIFVWASLPSTIASIDSLGRNTRALTSGKLAYFGSQVWIFLVVPVDTHCC